ncbi:MAG TPA: hypothetical protein VKR22_04180 [Acidimicrobiales bacterium]|nr:hypothetical protein [Acidimicrobiales bacterium]
MPPGTRVGIVLSIAAVTGMSACSSTSMTSSATAASKVNPAFLQRADGACSDAVAKGETNDGRAFPYSDFDPMHPNVKTLPLVGQFFQHAAPGWRDIRTRFDELGTPASGGASWSRVVALVNASADNVATQVQAALASDPTRFVATVQKVSQLQPQLSSAMSAAGFASSSPCVTFLTH